MDGVATASSVRYRFSEDQHEEADMPWTEFEDWLLQDTFARYAIGSGKHVLWNRMVTEVPELIGRTPQEARRRWLHITGRLTDQRQGGGSGAAAAAAKQRSGSGSSGAPDVETFYLQPPLLHDWEELEDGSFEGSVEGMGGLADGVLVRTRGVDLAGRRVADQYVRTECGAVFELGARRGADDDAATTALAPVASAFAAAAPLLALASAAAVLGATVLTHHVQLEVFVV
ncbi:hypothetical protein JKP88DRAFT_352414 [Tribonema minus]|uniref:Myb-like domain-containing protein n=1 Tax=Tribonema minus TaxID=303371 RepID=A0A836CN06_9STRA|nr:hypothetical protein JKP88DRAFT_352414 [Tribonema minus]